MGLPIWRDPEENRNSGRSTDKQPDPTASSRSSIRRRPSVHGRRNARDRSTRPHSSNLPPRFERSPPPSLGFSGLRESRRGVERGVPPISNLLEAADRERRRQDSSAEPFQRTFDLRRNNGLNDDPAVQRRILQHMAEFGRNEEFRRGMRELHERNGRPNRHHELDRNAVRDIAISVQRSPTPPAEQGFFAAPPTILLNSGEPLRILRSPEPMSRRSRPHSRNGSNARRNALPTPPLDTSGSDESTDIPQERRGPAHPLSRSWRPDSPIDGLGDRIRSPTPGDGWEIMRTTITPDETLPSAESSFASAAASQSFNNSSDSTQIMEPDRVNMDSRRDLDLLSDSGSDLDPDFGCLDAEEEMSTEAFAHEMYMFEMQSSAGRQRIAHHERIRDQEGNRYALASEPERVDIGFRLIEEALDTTEGRERLLRLRNNEIENIDLETEDAAARMVRTLDERRQHQRPPPLERPAASTDVIEASREARRQVHDYFRRFGADALAPRSLSPPPQYEQLSAQPSSDTVTSRDAPEAHPVSPPSQRSEREVSEALLSGDVQDLDSMRRIVERLAARDDVPDEWWMSMGLNLSRTRPRDRSPRRRVEESRDHVRTGRIERGNSRL